MSDILKDFDEEREAARQAVREAAERYGLNPDLLEAQAYQESGFNPRARSHAGAMGVGQFMPGTWRRYGVEPGTGRKMDPWNPRDSADAMARYMKDLLDQFGDDPELALAGYNAGENRRSLREGTLEGLKPETMNYIPAILKHWSRVSGARQSGWRQNNAADPFSTQRVKQGVGPAAQRPTLTSAGSHPEMPEGFKPAGYYAQANRQAAAPPPVLDPQTPLDEHYRERGFAQLAADELPAPPDIPIVQPPAGSAQAGPGGGAASSGESISQRPRGSRRSQQQPRVVMRTVRLAGGKLVQRPYVIQGERWTPFKGAPAVSAKRAAESGYEVAAGEAADQQATRQQREYGRLAMERFGPMSLGQHPDFSFQNRPDPYLAPSVVQNPEIEAARGRMEVGRTIDDIERMTYRQNMPDLANRAASDLEARGRAVERRKAGMAAYEQRRRQVNEQYRASGNPSPGLPALVNPDGTPLSPREIDAMQYRQQTMAVANDAMPLPNSETPFTTGENEMLWGSARTALETVGLGFDDTRSRFSNDATGAALYNKFVKDRQTMPLPRYDVDNPLGLDPGGFEPGALGNWRAQNAFGSGLTSNWTNQDQHDRFHADYLYPTLSPEQRQAEAAADRTADTWKTPIAGMLGQVTQVFGGAMALGPAMAARAPATFWGQAAGRAATGATVAGLGRGLARPRPDETLDMRIKETASQAAGGFLGGAAGFPAPILTRFTSQAAVGSAGQALIDKAVGAPRDGAVPISTLIGPKDPELDAWITDVAMNGIFALADGSAHYVSDGRRMAKLTIHGAQEVVGAEAESVYRSKKYQQIPQKAFEAAFYTPVTRDHFTKILQQGLTDFGVEMAGTVQPGASRAVWMQDRAKRAVMGQSDKGTVYRIRNGSRIAKLYVNNDGTVYGRVLGAKSAHAEFHKDAIDIDDSAEFDVIVSRSQQDKAIGARLDWLTRNGIGPGPQTPPVGIAPAPTPKPDPNTPDPTRPGTIGPQGPAVPARPLVGQKPGFQPPPRAVRVDIPIPDADGNPIPGTRQYIGVRPEARFDPDTEDVLARLGFKFEQNSGRYLAPFEPVEPEAEGMAPTARANREAALRRNIARSDAVEMLVAGQKIDANIIAWRKERPVVPPPAPTPVPTPTPVTPKKGAAPTVAIEKRLKMIQQAITDGRFDEADGLIDVVLRLDPSNAAAQAARQQVLIAKVAATTPAPTPTGKPGTNDVLLRNLQHMSDAIKARDYDKAEILANMILGVDPANASALAAQRVIEAARAQQGTPAPHPDPQVEEHLQALRSALKNKLYVEADITIDAILFFDPKNAEALRARAQIDAIVKKKAPPVPMPTAEQQAKQVARLSDIYEPEGYDVKSLKYAPDMKSAFMNVRNLKEGTHFAVQVGVKDATTGKLDFPERLGDIDPAYSPVPKHLDIDPAELTKTTPYSLGYGQAKYSSIWQGFNVEDALRAAQRMKRPTLLNPRGTGDRAHVPAALLLDAYAAKLIEYLETTHKAGQKAKPIQFLGLSTTIRRVNTARARLELLLKARNLPSELRGHFEFLLEQYEQHPEGGLSLVYANPELRDVDGKKMLSKRNEREIARTHRHENYHGSQLAMVLASENPELESHKRVFGLDSYASAFIDNFLTKTTRAKLFDVVPHARKIDAALSVIPSYSDPELRLIELGAHISALGTHELIPRAQWTPENKANQSDLELHLADYLRAKGLDGRSKAPDGRLRKGALADQLDEAFEFFEAYTEVMFAEHGVKAASKLTEVAADFKKIHDRVQAKFESKELKPIWEGGDERGRDPNAPVPPKVPRGKKSSGKKAAISGTSGAKPRAGKGNLRPTGDRDAYAILAWGAEKVGLVYSQENKTVNPSGKETEFFRMEGEYDPDAQGVDYNPWGDAEPPAAFFTNNPKTVGPDGGARVYLRGNIIKHGPGYAAEHQKLYQALKDRFDREAGGEDPTFGPEQLRAIASGDADFFTSLRTEIEEEVRRLDFQGYSFKNPHGEGSIIGILDPDDVRNIDDGKQAIMEDGEIVKESFDDVERAANLKAFLGDSKMVNPDGTPKVYYHGSTKDFSRFDGSKAGKTTGNPAAGWGPFFSPDPEEASFYSTFGGKTGRNVKPVYLRIENPYHMSQAEFARLQHASSTETWDDAKARADARKAELVAEGHDGILIYQRRVGEGEPIEVVPFTGEQVKSATGNDGGYRRDTDDFTREEGEVREETFGGLASAATPPPGRPDPTGKIDPATGQAYPSRWPRKSNTDPNGQPPGSPVNLDDYRNAKFTTAGLDVEGKAVYDKFAAQAIDELRKKGEDPAKIVSFDQMKGFVAGLGSDALSLLKDVDETSLQTTIAAYHAGRKFLNHGARELVRLQDELTKLDQYQARPGVDLTLDKIYAKKDEIRAKIAGLEHEMKYVQGKIIPIRSWQGRALVYNQILANEMGWDASFWLRRAAAQGKRAMGPRAWKKFEGDLMRVLGQGSGHQAKIDALRQARKKATDPDEIDRIDAEIRQLTRQLDGARRHLGRMMTETERTRLAEWYRGAATSGLFSFLIGTVGRNIGGALLYQAERTMASVPETVLDIVVGAAQHGRTGRYRRTRAYGYGEADLRGLYHGITEGMVKAVRDIHLGPAANIHQGKYGVHKELNYRAELSIPGKALAKALGKPPEELKPLVFWSKIMNGVPNTIFRIVAAADQPFKTHAYHRELFALARAEALNEKHSDRLPTKGETDTRMSVRERTFDIIRNIDDEEWMHLRAAAVYEADVATFNNANPISNAISAARHRSGVGVNMAIDTALPVDRTPTNIYIHTIKNYTPIGPAWAVVKPLWTKLTNEAAKEQAAQVKQLRALRAEWDATKDVKRRLEIDDEMAEIEKQMGPMIGFDAAAQREFTKGLSGPMAGAYLVQLGYKLAAMGLMTGLAEDQEERDLWERSGRREASFNMKALKMIPGGEAIANQLDDWLPINSFAPLPNALIMGATWHRYDKAQEATDWISRVFHLASATSVQMPLAQGIKDNAAFLDPRQTDRAPVKVGRILSRYAMPGVSNLVGTLTRAYDTDENGHIIMRQPDTLFEAIKERVPGLRQQVTEKKSVFGDSLQVEGGALGEGANPFNARKDRTEEEPVLRELMEAQYTPSRPNRKKDELLPDYVERQTIQGQNIKRELEDMVGTPFYQSLPPVSDPAGLALRQKQLREAETRGRHQASVENIRDRNRTAVKEIEKFTFSPSAGTPPVRREILNREVAAFTTGVNDALISDPRYAELKARDPQLAAEVVDRIRRIARGAVSTPERWDDETYFPSQMERLKAENELIERRLQMAHERDFASKLVDMELTRALRNIEARQKTP
jgi:hypothetical protein